MQPLEERGYIIPAFNTGKIDYVDCARALAKTLLMQHPEARICLLTNDKHATDHHLFAYTHIVEDIDTANPYANDPPDAKCPYCGESGKICSYIKIGRAHV